MSTTRTKFPTGLKGGYGEDLELFSDQDIVFYPTSNIWISQGTKLIFEGTVPDDHEVKLQATSVTADRDVILPDRNGEIILDDTLSDGSLDIDVASLTVSGSGISTITSSNDLTLDAVNRVIVDNTPLKLGLMTTVERNTIIPQNGDVIYNTDTTRFEGFQDGNWATMSGVNSTDLDLFDFGYYDQTYHIRASSFLLWQQGNIDFGTYAAPAGFTIDSGTF